jgi:putative addiction module component (TIGR02574 family)
MPRAALQKIRDQALELTNTERAELAHDLLISLDGPADGEASEAWQAEIVGRVAQIDAGTTTLIDADELTRRIRSRIGKR